MNDDYDSSLRVDMLSREGTSKDRITLLQVEYGQDDLISPVSMELNKRIHLRCDTVGMKRRWMVK